MHLRVFAIIPVHNGIEHTLPTVRSLSALLHPRDCIVVVDDGSTDGTVRVLHDEHPEVIILSGDGNLWWSGAINQGARYALENGADFVLFLNNDVLLHPQFLEELLLAANEYPRALISSKILSAEEPWRIWCLGGGLSWLRGKHWVIGHNQPDDGRWESPREVDWLPGMSLLVPIQVFRQGIWVDHIAFPQYSGDSDFTLRAKQAGFRLVVWPKSRIYNKVRNSGVTSELLLGDKSFPWRLFWDSLFSIKSSAAFCTFGKFVLRHAPLWAWPLTLARFYSFYFLKCLQRGWGMGRRRGILQTKKPDPVLQWPAPVRHDLAEQPD